MSDFKAAEAANYQAEVREKLTRLKNSLDDRWVRWSAWERDFIISIVKELDRPTVSLSQRQYARVWLLWERSLN